MPSASFPPRATTASAHSGQDGVSRAAPASSPAGASQPAAALLPPASQPLTARLAAAGSRRTELEALLDAAPPDAPPAQLRALLLAENVAGKGSAASRAKVWRQGCRHGKF